MLTMWKLAPALAAGNTIVIKPAKETSTSILELAKLFQEVSIPDGVINIVPGPGSTVGSGLASHPDVDKIAFTGSTDTGRLIMQAATKNLKPVSLELGGNLTMPLLKMQLMERCLGFTLHKVKFVLLVLVYLSKKVFMINLWIFLLVKYNQYG
jgi:acyl-CoA reductase-like NAD-dependent aldehyde dehydrogenase